MEPETRYAKTVDGVHIAYQVRGDGPIDLVLIMGFAANFEVELEDAKGAAFADRLSAFSRLILFDKRGTGLSDRTQTPDLDMRAEDLRAVLDTVGSRRTALLGHSEGGALGAFFAATHPDRVSALILYGAAARYAWAPDYPQGMERDTFLAERDEVARSWGTNEHARNWMEEEAPSYVHDPDAVRWWAKAERFSASPASALEFFDVWYATDVRSVLGSVQAPTLVLCRPEAGFDGHSPYLAERIPGARYTELSGRDYPIVLGDLDETMSVLQGFLGSTRAEQADLERTLATVLFTDIVGSTERAATLPGAEWKALLERHHEIVRALLGRYRGREVSTAGDGFLATFDGPARAVRCAQAIVTALEPLGLEIRAGVHTGEVETIDAEIGGIALNIGARVGAAAGPSEVLVSSTVKELVVGSGITFEDRGDHDLKGIPDRWHLYRAVPQEGAGGPEAV
jgi:class 3 adenylate cyclase/alpha-beta hydrolase superfamily lysophospholipase